LIKAFGLGIIDTLDLVVVVEVPYRAMMVDERKTFPVERYRFTDRASIMNWKNVRFRHDV
jgi:hypothetical protein